MRAFFIYIHAMILTFTSRVGYLGKLKMHYLTVPKSILLELNDGQNKSLYNQRVNVSVNNGEAWKAGTVALGDETAYITFSNKRLKEANVKEGDIVEVHISVDHSEFGFDVPEEWRFALEQDEIAQQRFSELSKGFQRAIIYLVLQVKSSDKKIEKSLFYLENLKRSPLQKTTMRHILGKDLP